MDEKTVEIVKPVLIENGVVQFVNVSFILVQVNFLLCPAGIPPMIGFYAKLSVLQALIATGGAMHLALAVFAVMMSLVGAFYYLRVVKVMYFDPPITVSEVTAPLDVRAVLTLNSALLIVLGVVPGGLMTLCANAVLQMLAS